MTIIQPKTILSRVERLVYEALWSRTRNGTRKWRGVLQVPALQAQAVAKGVKGLRRKGVLSAAVLVRGNSRDGSLFVILKAPLELAVNVDRQSGETLTRAVKVA